LAWFIFTFLDLFKLNVDNLCETLNFYVAHATSRCNPMPNAQITRIEAIGIAFSPNEYVTFNSSVKRKYGKVAETELTRPNRQEYFIFTLLNSDQLNPQTKSNQNYKSTSKSWICAHLRGRELSQINKRTLTYKWA